MKLHQLIVVVAHHRCDTRLTSCCAVQEDRQRETLHVHAERITDAAGVRTTSGELPKAVNGNWAIMLEGVT